jgi:hypothetical protein
MTIDRLRTLLGDIGPPPTALEIAELLWMATHLTLADEPAAQVTEVTTPVESRPLGESEVSPPSCEDERDTGRSGGGRSR